MIALKVLLFFFGLVATISAIKGFIEKLVSHTKKSEEEYHELYTRGIIDTVDFWPTLLSILFWSGFYLINQL